MSKLAGRRFVAPASVETQVFDWGTIKWLSEPRVTATELFTMGVVLLEPGKGHARHNQPEHGQGDDRNRRKNKLPHLRPGLRWHGPSQAEAGRRTI